MKPVSQSCPIDNSEPDARCGKMCVLCADSGSIGMLRSASYDDCMVLLFGSSTLIPCFTFLH